MGIILKEESMPERIIESCDVKRLEILDEKGNADESLMPPLSGKQIKKCMNFLSFRGPLTSEP